MLNTNLNNYAYVYLGRIINTLNARFVAMQFIKFYILLFGLLVLGSLNTYAQRNCGTVEYMNQLNNVEPKEVFENWINQKQLAAPNTGQESFGEDEVTIYQIPVVIHIVHNGEEIGSGSNISESQIMSQLAVLNEDFRKLNADSINIPAEFKPLYSDIGFEFILAIRDPNNEATTGITRIQGSQDSWNFENSADNTQLKSHDYWPSEDYFNIWVTPLCCGQLGYAQYPETDLLQGLAAPYNVETDGVVITYDAFGSMAKDPTADLQSRFNLGRTATHEVGHFFGLRHVWGDGGCGVDDYITDTPAAEDNYTGCPTLGVSSTTCDAQQDMFMNYMDYVDDNCMNIFSHGQKDRMVIIVENSPRRLSLTKSLALIPPYCEDLAITNFITPGNGICNSQLFPVIEIRNMGICFINSTNISLFINNTLVANQDFGINLDVNQTMELSFNPINLTDFGNLDIKAKIETVNGTIDELMVNNELIQYSLRPELVTNLLEDFSTTNALWTVRTSQEISALNKEQSTFYSIANQAAVFNYYNNENSSDAYVSPKLEIGPTPKYLLFDYAYGYRAPYEDNFTVLASTDCGNTFTDTLFIESGANLATVTTPVAFYPSGEEDWQHIQIDLSDYINQEVVFSFTGKSEGGNRILIDNIQVVDESYKDIALIGLTSPSTICNALNEVVIWVENKGLVTIEDLSLKAIANGNFTLNNLSQINLLPGQQIGLPLIAPPLSGPTYVGVSLLNSDENNTNNNFSQTIIPPIESSNIPLRERFDSNKFPANWTLTGKGTEQSQGWNLGDNGLEFIADNSPAKGLKEMILLPPLNLSDLQSASMHFDFAYAFDGFNEELLTVKASANCGETYETLFIEGGEKLATRFITTPWLPNGDSDWKNMYVDLSNFAGSENVQVVVELTSAQGNNAFVKNIELFASNIIEPLNLVENTITSYPNPSSNGMVNISFNLDDVQPATLLIYNSQGAFVFKKEVNIALNQTFEIATYNFRNGMYFARLIGNEIDISRSFMVNN